MLIKNNSANIHRKVLQGVLCIGFIPLPKELVEKPYKPTVIFLMCFKNTDLHRNTWQEFSVQQSESFRLRCN